MNQRLRHGRRWIIFAAAILFSLLPAASLADAAYLAVKGGTLKLRETASTTAAILGVYPTGTWVMVLEEGGDFTKVQVGGKTGYMMNDYLTAGNDTIIAVRYVRTNTGAGVNFRESPAEDGAVITGVAEGTRVDVLLKGVAWYKVQVSGETGFIASKYLFTEAGGTSQYAVVNNPKSTQVLNLRETASTTGTVLGKYKNYKPVTILQSGDVWCKVQVDDKTGYMMTKYLMMTAAPFAAVVNNPNGGSYVNFRKGPSNSAAVISKLPTGSSLTVLDKGTNWSLVSVDGTTGYVSTWFLAYGY